MLILKQNRILLNFIVVVSGLFFDLGVDSFAVMHSNSVSPGEAQSQLKSCLRSSLKPKTPLARDEARARCLNSHAGVLPLSQCMQLARGFEYSGFSEKAKNQCLFEFRPSRLTATECFRWSKQFAFAENSEGARWECFRRFEQRMPRKVCLDEAKSMIYPPHADRAALYCH